MLIYIARRILQSLPVAFGVSVVCFLLVHIAPGDPLTSVLPPDASAQLQAEMRRIYGFDRPLPVQYGLWALKAIQAISAPRSPRGGRLPPNSARPSATR